MIGRIINNYRVMSLLGQGGMGQVYMAQHPVLSRKTAVKILHPDLARNEIVVARFMNEARAANAIGHPNIIDIIDAGILPEDGIPFLQMEFLEGESLAVRLSREHQLDVETAVDFASQTALALQAAHDKDIVHRDLKPDNLFIVQDRLLPRGERVKVLDFGIAKLRDDFRGDSIRTQSGSVLGTTTYMSPEQCQGMVERVDYRSDIYSLGIILYELLTGAPPFVSQGFADLVIAHMTQIPTDPREVNPAIPEHLAAAILQALQKKPEDRYPSMDAFRIAIAGGADLCVNPMAHRRSLSDGATPPPTTRHKAADTTLRRSAIEAVAQDTAVYHKPYRLYGAIAAGAAVLGTVLLILLTRPSTTEMVPEARPATRPTKRLPIEPIVVDRAAEPIPLLPPSEPEKTQEETESKPTPVALPGVSVSGEDNKDRARRPGSARRKTPSGKARPSTPDEDEDEDYKPAERW